MKKLMIVATLAAVASVGVANGADAELPLEDGVYSVTLTQKGLEESDAGKSKVVSTTIKGLYVKGYGEKDGAYLWNAKDTDTYINTFAKADTTKSYNETFSSEEEADAKVLELQAGVGIEVGDVLDGSIVKKASGKKWKVSYKEITKKNPVKLANGYLEKFAFVADEDSVTADGKADAGFSWDTMQGWGTGTANKNTATVKTVSGNMVDQSSRVYGTWKFQADSAAKKLADKDASIEQILASKKVELVK